MWAIANYYKDQDEDFEKFKILCRFINPQAAQELWDEKVNDDSSGVSDDALFWQEIKKHTKQDISIDELKERMDSPQLYDNSHLDTIERVE